MGNVIVPKEVLKEFGSEILRLWVAMSDYQNDQRISNNILKQVGENYRKIRNTIRFLLANTNGLESLEVTSFNPIDLWILKSARECFERVNTLFGEYEFSKAIQELTYFLNTELSGIYLDICKDNLYCNALSSKERRASQSVMALICGRLFGLLAPIFTYTINEALSHTQSKAVLESCGITKGGDVFEILYTPLPSFEGLHLNFDELLELRGVFLEQIDILKKDAKIKSTLEVDLSVPQKKIEFAELNLWLMVSNVRNEIKGEVLAEFTFGGENYKILRAQGHKCPRCWQFISQKADEPCGRCQKVLEGR